MTDRSTDLDDAISQGTHDAFGHCVLKAQRRADGDNLVTDLHFVRIAYLQDRCRSGRHLYNRQVTILIVDFDALDRADRPVAELHSRTIGSPDYVIVRDCSPV